MLVGCKLDSHVDFRMYASHMGIYIRIVIHAILQHINFHPCPLPNDVVCEASYNVLPIALKNSVYNYCKK